MSRRIIMIVIALLIATPACSASAQTAHMHGELLLHFLRESGRRAQGDKRNVERLRMEDHAGQADEICLYKDYRQ